MSKTYQFNWPSRAQIGWFVAIVIVVWILVSSTLLFFGQTVNETFSSINAGLSGSGGAGSAPVSAPQDTNAMGVAPQERMVIRNAQLNIEVESVTQADTQIRSLVSQVGGFIVTSSAYGEGSDMSIHLSTRIPAAEFDATMNAIQDLASKIRARSVTGQDVTEEFVDLEARLLNLEHTRDRVNALFEQATTVEEMIQINTTLGDLQGQIEQIQGRMRYLRDQVNLSTIDIEINPVPTITIVNQDGWQPGIVARGALRDMIAAGQGLLNLLIVLVVWLPFLLPFLILGWWIWRRRKRKTAQSS